MANNKLRCGDTPGFVKIELLGLVADSEHKMYRSLSAT